MPEQCDKAMSRILCTPVHDGSEYTLPLLFFLMISVPYYMIFHDITLEF